MAQRKVVITGIGMVTPLGTSIEKNWTAMCAGQSGIGPITRFNAEAYDCRIAGECRDFRSEDWIAKKDLKKMDMFIHFGLAAAQMAWEDAKIQVTEENADRIGVIIGSGIGGLNSIQNQAWALLEKGPSRISPFFIPMSLINLLSGHLAIKYGLKGPNHSVVTACATGTHSIGDAMRIIKRGDADVMVAGGAEAAICELGVGGFASAKALTTRNDNPTGASRPWDRDRDGFVISEGAGIVVLETLESAQARGATLYAEVVGYGMSGDAYHITAPASNGDGAFKCMQAALRDAQITPDQIHYINAHGTSTPLGDIIETKAVKRVFGDHAKRLMMSSTKSMIGHLLGAAGGVEAIVTALSLYHGVVTPTINLDHPDPECDLDYVPHTARDAALEFAMSNSFGFGGTNASILLKKVH